jgi:hypothetical protein
MGRIAGVHSPVYTAARNAIDLAEEIDAVCAFDSYEAATEYSRIIDLMVNDLRSRDHEECEWLRANVPTPLLSEVLERFGEEPKR